MAAMNQWVPKLDQVEYVSPFTLPHCDTTRCIKRMPFARGSLAFSKKSKRWAWTVSQWRSYIYVICYIRP